MGDRYFQSYTPSQYAQAMSRLYSEEQENMEVSDFITSKMTLFNEIEPDKPEQYRISAIIERLRPEIRSYLRGKPITRVDQLIRVATHVQNDLKGEPSRYIQSLSSLYGEEQGNIDVSAFIEKKLALFGCVDTDRPEAFKVRIIIEQLRPEIRINLRNGDITKVEELIRIATDIQNDLEAADPDFLNSPNYTGSSGNKSKKNVSPSKKGGKP